jgi:DNA-binding XRE family transcriptional regulator
MIPEWTFGDRLRKIRRDVAYADQGTFAHSIGVTRQAYASWEAGRSQPRDLVALSKRIELLTGVPAAWLLGLNDEGAGTLLKAPPTLTYPAHKMTRLRLLRLVPSPGIVSDAYRDAAGCATAGVARSVA